VKVSVDGESGEAPSADGVLPLWKHRERRARKPPLLFGSRGPGSLYRRAKSLLLLCTRDRNALSSFLRADFPEPFPAAERLRLVRRFVAATDAIRCFHTQAEMLVVAEELCRMGRRNGSGPTVVECGVAKGASSAKLSLVVSRLGGQLHLYDSFRGMPANDEKLTRLDGSEVVFFKGAFTGRIPTVTRNLQLFGRPECVTLHKGLFQETMPGGLPASIDLALLDVDLLSSTAVCVRHIYPRLRAGGVLYSQDGHLREIVELLGSEVFWRDEVGCPKPEVEGLGVRKFLRIQKPSDS
jgi:Macrocin-O-methyltransferase (TylF).